MSAQADSLRSALGQNNHRVTPARQAIIECLVQSGGHISADDLAMLVREEAPHVGRATVFRTLDLLAGLGLVRPIYQGTAAAHYILLTEGSHHHLICHRCQRIIEFDTCGAGELVEQLGQQFGFQVQSHMLEVYGLCESCHE